MMTDFNDAFGKETSMDKAIPDEVLASLCADLPDNFMYVRDENGEYMVVPRPDKLHQGIRLSTEFDFNQENDAELLHHLKKSPWKNGRSTFIEFRKWFLLKMLRLEMTRKRSR